MAGEHPSTELPASEARIIAVNVSQSVVISVPFSLTYREFSHRGCRIFFRELLDLVKSAPVLQVAYLAELTFPDVPHDGLSDYAMFASLTPLKHRKLRKLSLSDMSLTAQALLLKALSLPTSLLYVSASADVYRGWLRWPATWGEFLHPTVANSLGRLDFTTLRVYSTYMELCEPRSNGPTSTGRSTSTDTPQPSRTCSLILRCTGAFRNLLCSGSPPPLGASHIDFDLANIKTLIATNLDEDFVCGWGSEAWPSWGHLTGVEELVLHNSWWTSWALGDMPALREIRIQRTNLDARHSRESHPAEDFVRDLHQRDLEARYRPDLHFEPVQRVVLEKCTGVEGFVDVLNGMLEIVIVD